MKIIYFLLAAVGILLLFIIAAIAIFAVTFDANDYKQELSEETQQSTGRDLSFNGDISLTVFPQLGMSLGEMELSGPPGFDDQPMLRVEKTQIGVGFLSLLRFQPEIDQLILNGLELNLKRDNEGRTNWDDLQSKDEDTAEEEPVVEEPASDDAVAVQATFDWQGKFGGLNIQNARIHYQDELNDQDLTLTVKELLTSEIKPDEPFDLHTEIAVMIKNQLDAQLTLDTSVLFEQQSLKLTGLAGKLLASGQQLPVNRAEMGFSADVDFAIEQQQLAVRGFAITAVAEGGAVEKASLAAASEVGFDLQKQLLTLAVVDVKAEVKSADLPKGTISAGVSSETLSVDLNKRSVDLEKLVVFADKARFEGFVRVQDYAQPALSYSLRSDKVDLDEMLGLDQQTPETQAPVAEETTPAEDVEIALPMDLLRALKLDGELRIDQLKASNLRVTDLRLSTQASQGKLTITPSMKLYQGLYQGEIGLNVQSETPRYSLSQQLASFQIGPFLKDFMEDDLVSGKTDLTLSATTQGSWVSELKKGLDGSFDLAVLDGAFKGINFRHEIAVAKAKLAQQDPPEYQEKKTDFSSLTLSGTITEGVVYSDDLDVKAPLVRVEGEGKADLVEERINYTVQSKLVATTKGQQSGGVDDLSGIPLPVQIKGRFDQLKFNILYDDYIKARFNAEKQQLKQKVDAEKQRLQQQLDEEKQKLEEARKKEQAAAEEKLRQEAELKEAELKEKADKEKQKAKEKAEKALKDKLDKLF